MTILIRFQRNGALIRTCCVTYLVMIALLYGGICYAETLRAKVHKGNVLYDQRLYDEALEMYNNAQIDAPESPELNFNMGNVNYRKEDYENAIGTYSKSFRTEDIQLESKANYNVGNAKYRLGEKSGNAALWREAIEYYKRAIELDPNDVDAKYNLEFVEKKIKDAVSKQREDQQKSEEEQQQEQPQEKPEQSKENGSAKPDKQERTSEGQDGEKQEEKEAAKQPQQQFELEQVPARRQENAEHLAEQEIYNILQGEEKTAREQALSRIAPYERRVAKDW